MYYYQLKSVFCFLPNLFCSRIPYKTPYYIKQTCCLDYDSFSVSLFLMTVIILRSAGQVSHGMSFIWDLSDLFLIVRMKNFEKII